MEKILVIDYGSQFNQLIARRVREMGVYTEIVEFDEDIERFMDDSVKGIILSGGPNSVYESGAPTLNKKILELGKPVLGICYGMQVIQHTLGGVIESSDKREYGKSTLSVIDDSNLFKDIPKESIMWMSHGDHVTQYADNFTKIAQTDSCIAAVKHNELDIYGVQFHPEVTHSEYGSKVIENFVDICKTSRSWSMSNYISSTVSNIKETVKDKKVILGLSGGVDSSVCAMLLHKAIGDNLTCIFVDTGLLRKDEGNKVMDLYSKNYNMNIKRVDAGNLFLDNLKGIKDPEEKRKIIGKLFIDVFDSEKKKMKDADYLAQGTIYPDVIESASKKGAAHTIKSHHNVGGLPDDIDFELIEPLRDLFKDEVRRVGLEMGIPRDMIMRHPFPGPGLGIRIIEEVTKEKVEILQNADNIFINELMNEGLYEKTSQAFVTLLPCKTVGVMGDGRTYEYVAAIRSVNTIDFMSATFSRLPYEFLDKVATKMINEVKGINRIVYDITSKPPGTIEWE